MTNTLITIPADAATILEEEELAWWIDPAYEAGFAFEPDAAVVDATAGLLIAAATGFDGELAAARKLATVDAASKLGKGQRATLASNVQVAWPDREGFCGQLTSTTYSKRCKAGRATDDQVLTFLMACATPSLDKLYEWLPKEAGVGRPKGSKTAPKVVEPEPEVSEPETTPEPCRWDAEHVATAAKALLANLRAQGADDVSARLVAAEAMRLLSPVRSVA